MLRISLIELLVKGLPEGLITIFGVFALTKTKLDSKKFVISSAIFVFLTYLIRLLPLSYGVNIMLSLLVVMLLSVIFINVELSKAIKANLIIVAIIIVSETVTIGLMQAYLGKDKIAQIMSEPISKSVASVPSTLLFGIVVTVVYIIFKKNNAVKKDSNGETISINSK